MVPVPKTTNVVTLGQYSINIRYNEKLKEELLSKTKNLLDPPQFAYEQSEVSKMQQQLY